MMLMVAVVIMILKKLVGGMTNSQIDQNKIQMNSENERETERERQTDRDRQRQTDRRR